MGILNAATQAQKQIFNHLLTELEAMGVVTLSDARLIMSREVSNFRKERVSKQPLAVPKNKVCPVPECGGFIRRFTRKDLDKTTVVIDKCDKCEKSWIVRVP